jgi:hypothetical protein
VLGERMRRYDKGGEQFYDTISRAAQVGARLRPRRLALLVRAHARRRRRSALHGAPAWSAWRVEDIGLADPRALRLALDAADVYERLGTPEGELALAECLVYLAMAPKSNAVYVAYNEARALVRKEGTRPVPVHLRNAPTRLMKDLGYGKDYRYAHDEEGGFAAGETYFPEGMKPPQFYRPVERGLEIRIGEKLRELRGHEQQGTQRRRAGTPLHRQSPFGPRQAVKPLERGRRCQVAIPLQSRPNEPAHGSAWRVFCYMAKRPTKACFDHSSGKENGENLLWRSCCSRSSMVWSWAACTP